MTQFGTERHDEAVIGMFQAKAATELYLVTARPDRSSSHQPAAESIDLVSQYGLAELLTPPSVDGQAAAADISTRSCA